jgi:hypothetical protein
MVDTLFAFPRTLLTNPGNALNKRKKELKIQRENSIYSLS